MWVEIDLNPSFLIDQVKGKNMITIKVWKRNQTVLIVNRHKNNGERKKRRDKNII